MLVNATRISEKCKVINPNRTSDYLTKDDFEGNQVILLLVNFKKKHFVDVLIFCFELSSP